MLTLLLSAALAQSEPCPDPAVSLGRAESDALSYFLADAEAGLAKAMDAWACGPPATPDHIARYLRIKGLLAHYGEKDDISTMAFAAAKRLGGPYNDDYGDEVRTLWEEATLPEGEPATLVLKGLEEGERVWVDGLPTELSAAPGFHLLQVAPTEDAARFARLLLAEPAAELVVSVTGVPLPAPAPAPAPAQEPEPEPEPDDGIEWGPRVIPERAQAIAPPLVHLEGNAYEDGDTDPLRWRADVLPLARYDVDGRIARRRYRNTRIGQLVAATLTTGFAYSAYLQAWDLTTGHNQPPGRSGLGTLFFTGAAVGTGAWGWHLIKKRPKHRVKIEASAQRVITGNAL